jgi:hypothetical protein
MPGIADKIDGAIQHAPQPLRQENPSDKLTPYSIHDFMNLLPLDLLSPAY